MVYCVVFICRVCGIYVFCLVEKDGVWFIMCEVVVKFEVISYVV